MTYQDALERAIQQQLEIERKAAAWDRLREKAQNTPVEHLATQELLDLMSRLEHGA